MGGRVQWTGDWGQWTGGQGQWTGGGGQRTGAGDIGLGFGLWNRGRGQWMVAGVSGIVALKIFWGAIKNVHLIWLSWMVAFGWSCLETAC